MRQIVQTHQRWDQTVVDQALSVLDPTQTRHDVKYLSQKQVGGMIAPVIVVGPTNQNLQEATNLQTPAECLKQTQLSEASQAAFFEGELEFPVSFGHTSKPYLKGRFVKRPFHIDEICY